MNIHDEHLIFIISLPRSGSTLLQRLLANKEIYTTSESWMALPLLDGNIFDNVKLQDNLKFGSSTAKRAISNFRDELNLDDIKESAGLFYSNITFSLLKHKKQKYFLDKTPRYYLIFDELRCLFPNAKFIILHRDPLSVIKSIFSTWVGRFIPMLSYYSIDLLKGVKILDQIRKQNFDNCLNIDYEALISSPKKVLDEISNFIGLNSEIDIDLALSNTKSNWLMGDPKQAKVAKKIMPSLNKSYSLPSFIGYRNKLIFDYASFLSKKVDYKIREDIKKELINKNHFINKCLIKFFPSLDFYLKIPGKLNSIIKLFWIIYVKVKNLFK
jgi:hypothetical protein